MKTDDAVRARNDGKARTAKRTAWILDIGALRVRCLRQDDDSYVVQGRMPQGWTEPMGQGADPVVLLQRVTQSAGVARTLGSNTITEIMKLRSLYAALPRCDGDGGPCGKIATWSHGTCDRHRYRADGMTAREVPYAEEVRALQVAE